MGRQSTAVSIAAQSPENARMSWSALLCQARLYPKKRAYAQDRTPFEIDYDRIIFSKAFRRLARKTQVHPLAINDHTHNRLTHSLEVASVGRSLGKTAFDIASRYEEKNIPATALDFAKLVQAACLAHDVGNTPFGHAGERAIRHWMLTNQSNVLKAFSATEQSDFVLYEGNAQAFRIATRSVSGFENRCNNRKGGLGLTAATLATMMKYPWYSDNEYAQAEGKYSVFQSDTDAFEWTVNTTGLLQKNNAYCRHPLAFLVEAADDICNAVIDIEDAIDLHILHRNDVEDSLRVLSDLPKDCTIAAMRATAIGKLIDQCLMVFDKHYEAIMLGEQQQPLIEGIEPSMHHAFESLNAIAREKVYPFQQDENLEQSCISILARILSVSIEGDKSISELPLDTVISPYLDFINALSSERKPSYESMMMIMDFVAGMTDNYAVNLAGRLETDPVEWGSQP